ncbi:MAG: Unknown protein [uncultured Sulfurovum sp.]|uniref:Uncharacterized protein n=1 Tax=uncultured Sulfurovum sp. TaxID=269237 RepID=A0A6S6U025_9BACT|nr:MAG: Unknown protein [uncultured Sulfurovum sp.]
MKNILLATTIVALTFTGCSSTKVKPPKVHYTKPTPSKEKVFKKAMREVALSTRNDSRYTKMELNTPEKKMWFKNLMYLLWDRQITRNEFISRGLKKYPKHAYEFTFVAHGFQK